MSEQVVVYGTGGSGREIAWLAACCRDRGTGPEVVCFVDDDEKKWGSVINGLRVIDLSGAKQLYPEAGIIIGVGNPRTRERLVQRAVEMGFRFVDLIYPGVERSKWIEHGEGLVICAGCILSVNIRLGRHVQINFGCTISHDVVMGDFTTLAPGVHVTGCVHLGRRVWVGAGATFVNGTPEEPIVIGDDVVIGAGACVTKSIPSGTWVGVPARPLRTEGTDS